MPVEVVIGAAISQDSWLKRGERVITVREISLEPYGVISPGMRGSVIYMDPETLYTEILLDERCRALDPWDNCLWVMPDGTPEILQAIRRTTKVWEAEVSLSPSLVA